MGSDTKNDQVDGRRSSDMSHCQELDSGGQGPVANRSTGAGALRSLAQKRMEKRVSGTPGSRE